MNQSTRRAFIQTSAGFLAAIVAGSSLPKFKYTPPISFSTLGCPDWTFQQIVDFASAHEYSGIELRGILREMDLTKCKEFLDADSRRASLKMMEEKGLRFVDLGSSANMHISDAPERKKNLDEARRFIDLAHDLNCPYIRVFPNSFPKDQDRNATMDLIAKGLLELGEHAKGSSVSVLVESHGDLVKIDDLEKVMNAAANEHVGMVWDVTNMWTTTKESPTEAYTRLKKYIRHTHIKDALITDGKIQYVLLGKGVVPIFEAIDILAKDGYKGYYSFEWEKLWHPEIAEPAIALADFPEAMKAHFEKIKL